MAFVQSRSLSTPRIFFSRPNSLSPRNVSTFPKLHVRIFGNSLPVLACSARTTTPASEQAIFDAVLNSDGGSLPAVRTYENDLARLSLVGSVYFEQALTAAAVDGGEVASEHIVAGLPTMVVETVCPGPSGEHSTVSTRLFLPTTKVREKAKRLRSSGVIDSNTTSQKMLAMTFRQVVLEQLWNFELVLFRPGTERNMEELENPREVPISLTMSSPDERVISLLGEVVCLTALESTERHFLRNSLGRTSTNFSSWFQKAKSTKSMDSAITIHKLFEDEIIASAKSLLGHFNSKRANYKPLQTNIKYSWWTLSTHSELEKIGGPEFSTWISEYIPAYRVEMETDRLQDVKFEGWKKSAENRWEVLLTHSQMVGLANVLDIFFEDSYTLPSKQLSCGTIAKPTKLSSNKRIASVLKVFSIALASGCFLVTVGIFSQVCFPYMQSGRKYFRENHSIQSSDIEYVQHDAVEPTKLEAFCTSIVEKIKDAFGWPGDITTEKSVGAWIGELPLFLRRLDETDSSFAEIRPSSYPSNEIDEELKNSTQDIASYQVVLSADGNIVGFQPTNRVAVNHWAANPLAKELYGGRKLSPGLIELGLNISSPSEPVVIVELLMSVKSNSSFALARPGNTQLP